MEAFYQLECFLKQKDNGERQLVFLDEMPWMDTPRSGFLQAFEGFWNNWACHRKNIMVIVGGSANSWMLDHLINNYSDKKITPKRLMECLSLRYFYQKPFGVII